VLNTDKDVVLKQGHNDRLNFNDIIESISSLQRSMLLLTVSILSVSLMKSMQTSLVSYVLFLSAAQPQSLMYVFEQQDRKKVIFLMQTSHFVFNKWRSVKKCTFAVLSLIKNDKFCKHHTNSCDKLFIITVLWLLSVFCFIMQNNNKWLKLMTSTTILKEAHSEWLHVMVAILQHSVQKLIQQFKNYKDSKKKLWSLRR